jgi:hypothetical protein
MFAEGSTPEAIQRVLDHLHETHIAKRLAGQDDA